MRGGLFRKVPVVVQAYRFDGKDLPISALQKWCGGEPIKDGNRIVYLVIKTLEGDMRAERGDYIIKGVNGEFYPCKPDIFEKTYEEFHG